MHCVHALSEWFHRVQRPLPWRQTRDPYAIWISEVMLQQTQVSTVLPYYERFLTRFPKVADLAHGPLEDVLKLWSGLGYYSRARNLWRGAQYLVETHGASFPRTREALRAVPGIGPYTAGAVLSIAFDLPEALVDGNVQRVFSRYFALPDLLESKTAQAFFWSKAAQWVRAAKSPRILNQALMELGATVCTKGQPRCEICPLANGCEARRHGKQSEFPHRKPRRKAQDLWWLSFIHERRGKILLVQNPQGEWWEGLWDFPREAVASAQAVSLLVQDRAANGPYQTLSEQKHTVTHHRIHVAPIVLGFKPAQTPTLPSRWVTMEQARDLPLSSLAKKTLRAYQAERKRRNHASPS